MLSFLMSVGYAIIQLPELVSSIYLFAKSRIMKNRKFPSANLDVINENKGFQIWRQRTEMLCTEGIVNKEVKLLKPSSDRISEGRFLQFDDKVTSILGRMDII